jgi:hypothetical protein
MPRYKRMEIYEHEGGEGRGIGREETRLSAGNAEKRLMCKNYA